MRSRYGTHTAYQSVKLDPHLLKESALFGPNRFTHSNPAHPPLLRARHNRPYRRTG
jgi:hypothetical protein